MPRRPNLPLSLPVWPCSVLRLNLSPTGIGVGQIVPMFAEVLAKAKARAGSSEFCFPDAAIMYRSNPDGFTWPVKQARCLHSRSQNVDC